MEIIKKAECSVSRDANVLAVTNDFIVVNNNNGINIFDTDLKKVREMQLRDDLAIRHIYTNYKKNELILYCPGNGCVIWVDLVNAVHKVIPLPEMLFAVADSPSLKLRRDYAVALAKAKAQRAAADGVISRDTSDFKPVSASLQRTLSAAYYWLGDLVIFVPRDFEIYCDFEEYYELNIATSTWDTISFDVLKYASPGLAKLIETIFINSASDFQLRDGYIVEDRADNPEITIVIYDDFFHIDRVSFAYHDILYAHNMIAFVGDTQIQVFVPSGGQHDREYQRMVLEVSEGYQFLKVTIDLGSHGLRLVVLSKGSNSNSDSLLTLFGVYGIAQVSQ